MADKEAGANILRPLRADGTSRSLRADDAEAAVAVIHEAFSSQAVQTDPPSSALRETADTIRALILAGGGAGIEAGGRLVAVVLWREAEGGLYFGRMSVRREARGQGYAALLIDAAEAEARRRGLARVHVGVRLQLPANRRMFESRGYTAFRPGFKDGYAEPVSMDLEKHLGAG